MKLPTTQHISKLLLASSFAFIGLGISSVALAENNPDAVDSHVSADSHSEVADAHAPLDHSESGHHHPTHAFGLFLGGTTTSVSTEFSVGLEYEYRINQYFGVGIIAEQTPDASHFTHGATIALAAFHAHPWRGLRLTTAVGAEVGHGDVKHETEDGGHDAPVEHAADLTPHARAAEHAAPEKAGSDVLVRLGAAYDFEVAENIAIAPTVNVDFVNGDVNAVYGMVFTYHF